MPGARGPPSDLWKGSGVDISVTVCELPDDLNEFATAWGQIQRHVETESSDLLILNEAPFDRWFALADEYVGDVWNTAVERHGTAIDSLQLPCGIVATAPINQSGRRYNRAFSWTPDGGIQPWRRKAYLPDESRALCLGRAGAASDVLCRDSEWWSVRHPVRGLGQASLKPANRAGQRMVSPTHHHSTPDHPDRDRRPRRPARSSDPRKVRRGNVP